ncbi:MAG: transposase [Bryobacteraceae bacterium]|nr:transposase [Bryobacteraceae bacterium]
MRRDNGASYDEYVAQLMANEGIEEPTPAERQRFDRRRKKSLSNREWVNPHDPEARITKLKDGRTQLAYKAEHAVDLDTGAVVALTVQPADRGDPESLRVTLAEAGSVVAEMAGQAAEAGAVGPVEAVSPVGVERVVADKGYHSQPVLEELAAVGVRTVIAEPQRQRRRWAGQRAGQAAVYANRRRLRTRRGKALMRRRGTQIERSFAHLYGTGGLQRVHLRSQDNIAKRLLLHAAAFNLSLILRRLLGVGTARQAADRLLVLSTGCHATDSARCSRSRYTGPPRAAPTSAALRIPRNSPTRPDGLTRVKSSAPVTERPPVGSRRR